MATVSKKMLVRKVTDKTQLALSQVSRTIEELLQTMREELQEGNRIELRNFGVFSVKRYPAKIGRNPRTGERVEIPSRNKVLYKPGKELKKLVAASERPPAEPSPTPFSEST